MTAPSSPDIDLLILGSGTSSSIPLLSCLTSPPGPADTGCHCCRSTLPSYLNAPERTPAERHLAEGNKRRNTSGLLRIRGGDGREKTVLIDVRLLPVSSFLVRFSYLVFFSSYPFLPFKRFTIPPPTPYPPHPTTNLEIPFFGFIVRTTRTTLPLPETTSRSRLNSNPTRAMSTPNSAAKPSSQALKSTGPPRG
jgi:hypothetical protein